MWDLRTSTVLLFSLITLAACCKGPPRPTGLVIVGGDPEGGTSVELWSPQEQCRLPPLDRLMFSPTVDTLGAPGGWWVAACDGDLCFELKKKPAAEIAKEAKAYHAAKKKNKRRRKPKKLIEPPKGRWENLTTIEWRVAHTSAITPDGLLLVGGSGSPNTTELIPRKREEGEGGYMGFSLEIGRQFHCSIQIDETSIVLTGGLGRWAPISKVNQRNGFRHGNPGDGAHRFGRFGGCSESGDCKSDHRSLLPRLWHVHSGRI